MDYYKYISEYLPYTMQELKDNAIFLDKTAWPKNFIEQYNTMGGVLGCFFKTG
jgi:hypothetical protein